MGEIDAVQYDKDDIGNFKSVKYTEDLTLLSVLNARYGFVPKEDAQNPSGLAAQLGIDQYLNANEPSSISIFFKAVSIDPQKFHILLVNYDKSRSRQLSLRWWAIPVIGE
jgi:hypothetical protein